MIPADAADIVPSSSEELTEELWFPRETVEIRVVLEGEDIETLLSKMASGILVVSKEGITMDVSSAAERLVEGLINVEKSTEEVAKCGLFEVPSVSRDETDV